MHVCISGKRNQIVAVWRDRLVTVQAEPAWRSTTEAPSLQQLERTAGDSQHKGQAAFQHRLPRTSFRDRGGDLKYPASSCPLRPLLGPQARGPRSYPALAPDRAALSHIRLDTQLISSVLGWSHPRHAIERPREVAGVRESKFRGSFSDG